MDANLASAPDGGCKLKATKTKRAPSILSLLNSMILNPKAAISQTPRRVKLFVQGVYPASRCVSKGPCSSHGEG